MGRGSEKKGGGLRGVQKRGEGGKKRGLEARGEQGKGGNGCGGGPEFREGVKEVGRVCRHEAGAKNGEGGQGKEGGVKETSIRGGAPELGEEVSRLWGGVPTVIV